MLIICVDSSITHNPGGPVDAVVNAAAKRLGATSNQVIFSWVRSKGVAIVTYVHLLSM
jgi:diketogulonate reductase-like aldo/keto reductase